jgi:hypothetical protein
MKIYRIKTKEEFEKEFGEGWRRNWGSNILKDHLLGQRCPSRIKKLLIDGKQGVVPWRSQMDLWAIRRTFLVEEEI